MRRSTTTQTSICSNTGSPTNLSTWYLPFENEIILNTSRSIPDNCSVLYVVGNYLIFWWNKTTHPLEMFDLFLVVFCALHCYFLPMTRLWWTTGLINLSLRMLIVLCMCLQTEKEKEVNHFTAQEWTTYMLVTNVHVGKHSRVDP